jgi:ferric-dicitrate binding protein FerR (iron transport regulator)
MDSNLIEKILSDTANEVEKKQFYAWLKQSNQNRELYEKTKVLWERLEGVYANSSFDQ